MSEKSDILPLSVFEKQVTQKTEEAARLMHRSYVQAGELKKYDAVRQGAKAALEKVGPLKHWFKKDEYKELVEANHLAQEEWQTANQKSKNYKRGSALSDQVYEEIRHYLKAVEDHLFQEQPNNAFSSAIRKNVRKEMRGRLIDNSASNSKTTHSAESVKAFRLEKWRERSKAIEPIMGKTWLDQEIEKLTTIAQAELKTVTPTNGNPDLINGMIDITLANGNEAQAANLAHAYSHQLIESGHNLHRQQPVWEHLQKRAAENPALMPHYVKVSESLIKRWDQDLKGCPEREQLRSFLAQTTPELVEVTQKRAPQNYVKQLENTVINSAEGELAALPIEERLTLRAELARQPEVFDKQNALATIALNKVLPVPESTLRMHGEAMERFFTDLTKAHEAKEIDLNQLDQDLKSGNQEVLQSTAQSLMDRLQEAYDGPRIQVVLTELKAANARHFENGQVIFSPSLGEKGLDKIVETCAHEYTHELQNYWSESKNPAYKESARLIEKNRQRFKSAATEEFEQNLGLNENDASDACRNQTTEKEAYVVGARYKDVLKLYLENQKLSHLSQDLEVMEVNKNQLKGFLRSRLCEGHVPPMLENESTYDYRLEDRKLVHKLTNISPEKPLTINSLWPYEIDETDVTLSEGEENTVLRVPKNIKEELTEHLNQHSTAPYVSPYQPPLYTAPDIKFQPELFEKQPAPALEDINITKQHPKKLSVREPHFVTSDTREVIEAARCMMEEQAKQMTHLYEKENKTLKTSPPSHFR